MKEYENMSVSELKYLLAVEGLCEEREHTNLTAIAEKTGVSKASVSHALDRLEERKYIVRNERLISLAEKGKTELAEYNVIINFIAIHLETHCKINPKTAKHDAINVACVFSESSRRAIVAYMQN